MRSATSLRLENSSILVGYPMGLLPKGLFMLRTLGFMLLSLTLTVSCGDDKKSKSGTQGISYDQLNPSTVEGYLYGQQVEINGVVYQAQYQSQQIFQQVNQQVQQYQQQGLFPVGTQKYPATITGYVFSQCGQRVEPNVAYYDQCIARQTQTGVQQQSQRFVIQNATIHQ